MNTYKKIVLLPAIMALMTGCSANYHSIYRRTHADESQIINTDAKQAATIVNVDKEGVMRACAAKSPDVFQALSTAFNGSLSVEEAGNIAAKMAGAGSTAESAASYRLHSQLTDSQNELLFNLCENALNGKISPDQLNTELHRYQNTMVTMLGIEQLTGYAKPTIVALAGGSAGTGSAKDLATLQTSLDTLRANESKAQTLADKNAAALTKAQTDAATAKADSEANKDATKNAEKAAALKTANDAVTAAEKDNNASKAALATATKNRVSLEEVMAKAVSETAANATGAGAQIGTPAVTAYPDAEAVKSIAQAVVAMQELHLHQTFTTDECLSFLFGTRSAFPEATPYDRSSIKEFCLAHLKEVDEYKKQAMYLANHCDKYGENCFKGLRVSSNSTGDKSKKTGNQVDLGKVILPPSMYLYSQPVDFKEILTEIK